MAKIIIILNIRKFCELFLRKDRKYKSQGATRNSGTFAKVTHAWSFSGLATIVRIMLMYYIDVMGFLEHPEKDWEVAIEEAISSPPDTE